MRQDNMSVLNGINFMHYIIISILHGLTKFAETKHKIFRISPLTYRICMTTTTWCATVHTDVHFLKGYLKL